MDDRIEIGKNSVVEAGALIRPGPLSAIDGNPPGAYIRGEVIGNDCVVGRYHRNQIIGDAWRRKAGHLPTSVTTSSQ